MMFRGVARLVLQSAAETVFGSLLGRARGSDLAKSRVVGEPQLTGEAVPPDAEAPNALWNDAGELTTRPCETAGKDAHLLFVAPHDLPCVDRQTVRSTH